MYLKNRKNYSIFVLIILVTLFLCCFVACGRDGKKESTNPEESTADTFSFNIAKKELEIYEIFTIGINGENTELSNYTWSTSDDSVATVNNGVITAVGEGVATISATLNNETEQCAITVSYSRVIPVVKLNVVNNQLKLYEDVTYRLFPEIEYNGQLYTDFQADYSSDNTGIAEVSDDGTVSAKKMGNSSVTVNVNWRGLSFKNILTVQVIDSGTLIVDNNQISVYSSNPDGYEYETEKAISVKMVNLGRKVDVALNVEEIPETGNIKGVVALYENGTIKGVRAGKTTFVFSCEYNNKTYRSVEVLVTVNSPEVFSKEKLTYVKKGAVTDFSEISSEYTQIDRCYLDGEICEIVSGAPKLSGATVGAHKMGLMFDGRDIIYEYDLTVITANISNAGEFLSIKNDRTGYYVISKDIDLGGINIGGDWSENDVFPGHYTGGGTEYGSQGFTGILEGGGHRIYNFSIGANGLFGAIGIGGKVTNLGIEQINGWSDGWLYGGPFIGENWGTVENVSIKITASMNETITKQAQGIVGCMQTGSTMKNVVIYSTCNVKLSAFTYSPAIENVLFISKDTRAPSGVTALNVDTYLTDGTLNGIDLSGFDTENGYWTIDETLKIPFIEKVKSEVKYSVTRKDGDTVIEETQVSERDIAVYPSSEPTKGNYVFCYWKNGDKE